MQIKQNGTMSLLYPSQEFFYFWSFGYYVFVDREVNIENSFIIFMFDSRLFFNRAWSPQLTPEEGVRSWCEATVINLDFTMEWYQLK